MIRFNEYPVKPYIGTHYSKPVFLCGTTPARIVPLLIDWTSYNVSTNAPNLGVYVNLVGQAPAPIIDKIAAIYIDNTRSLVPIFVAFPDTQFVAVCQPNSTIWVPVLSNATECTVYGLGFATGAIPTTMIFLCDKYVDGFSDIERLTTFPQFRSSQTIPSQNLFSTGYGPPALGDQSVSGSVATPTSVGTRTQDLGIIVPYTTPGQIVSINSVFFKIAGVQTGASVQYVYRMYLSDGVNTLCEGSGFINESVLIVDAIVLSLSGVNIQIVQIADIHLYLDTVITMANPRMGRASGTVVFTKYNPLS